MREGVHDVSEHATRLLISDIAAYDDHDAAKVDWDTINQLADSGVIKVDGVVLVSRRLACRKAFRES